MSGDRQVAVSLYRALRRLALQYDRGPILKSSYGEHAAMTRNKRVACKSLRQL
jgi:hypothetical protein